MTRSGTGRNALTLTLAALSLGACQTTAQTPPGATVAAQAHVETPMHTTAIGLSVAQRTAVEASVRKALKDPESARFGTMRAGREASGNIAVCGMVNARNSFGGYTGEKPFIGALTSERTFVVVGIGGTADATTVTLDTCRKYGIPL